MNNVEPGHNMIMQTQYTHSALHEDFTEMKDLASTVHTEEMGCVELETEVGD